MVASSVRSNSGLRALVEVRVCVVCGRGSPFEKRLRHTRFSRHEAAGAFSPASPRMLASSLFHLFPFMLTAIQGRIWPRARRPNCNEQVGFIITYRCPVAIRTCTPLLAVHTHGVGVAECVRNQTRVGRSAKVARVRYIKLLVPKQWRRAIPCAAAKPNSFGCILAKSGGRHVARAVDAWLSYSCL